MCRNMLQRTLVFSCAHCDWRSRHYHLGHLASTKDRQTEIQVGEPKKTNQRRGRRCRRGPYLTKHPASPGDALETPRGCQAESTGWELYRPYRISAGERRTEPVESAKHTLCACYGWTSPHHLSQARNNTHCSVLRHVVTKLYQVPS
jgi:hypothetical protein